MMLEKDQSTQNQTQIPSNKVEDKFPYYISRPIREQFSKAKKIVHEGGQDRIYLATGREGSGKSTLLMQFAYYIDPRFNLDDIAFTAEDFENLIKTTNKKVVMFDEGFNGLSSKGALSKQNKKLVKCLIECRQRGLFIFIALPSLFLLEKYVAIFRSHALFNVMISTKNHRIRYYKTYSYEKKKLLYMMGHKYMSYSKPKILHKHRFYSKYPPTITQEGYEAKKLGAFRARDETEETENTIAMNQRTILFHYLNTEHNMSYEAISKVLKGHGCNLTPANIGVHVRKMRKIDRKSMP